MDHKLIVMLTAFHIFVGCSTASAAPQAAEVATVEAQEKVLLQMKREDRERGFQELSRAVSNLERKVNRLSDRIDQMEYDLKEVKRKTKVF